MNEAFPVISVLYHFGLASGIMKIDTLWHECASLSRNPQFIWVFYVVIVLFGLLVYI